jgi:LCP family protein required for cell wall assembly
MWATWSISVRSEPVQSAAEGLVLPGTVRVVRSRSPLPWMIVVAAAVGVTGTIGVLRAADSRTADVERIDAVVEVLADVPDDDTEIEYPAENYLLVGSDSREGVSGDSADAGVIGDASSVGGRRSDTIMILRQERNGGAALISIPRDLWVPISGTGRSSRINSAYNEGPERLAATVTEALGIPVHHYVEVDFVGFKQIVDELGGIEICIGYPARDTHSGLSIDAGCQRLDGVQALAFARSRYYEEWNGEQWVRDGRADLGRIERQQFFIRSAVNGVLQKIQSSPFGSGEVIDAVIDAVRIDARLDPIQAGEALRSAVQESLRTFRLPVVNATKGDAAVLELGQGSESVLAYFRGDGPPPVEFETTETGPGVSG